MLRATVFKNSTSNVFLELFRYTIVGGIAFIVDFSLLFALTEYLNINYLISAAFAFGLGLLTNYSLSVLWVFDRRSFTNKYAEFFTFSFIGIVGLLLNEIFMWFFTEIVLSHYMLSKIFSTFFVYLWNFTIRKLVLFR